MRKAIFIFLLVSLTSSSFSQTQKIEIKTDQYGSRLTIDNEPFIANGMNWDYFPIGTNYSYSLWTQPDDIIKEALDAEMLLLKNMGVNVIRQYTGVPARWIQYIYENYGIYTMLNHSFGRYGLNLSGAWMANTDYSDPRVKEVLFKEVTQMVKEYRNTPGLLLYLLGNENNYGLFWQGAETENIPVADRKSTIQARHMYQLFEDACVEMKKVDNSFPIAICNGDLQFLDIIAETCKSIDIFGINSYRGPSFGDTFERVKKELNKPLMFMEFGSDAYNARTHKEDQQPQAEILLENWREIYANVAGLGLDRKSVVSGKSVRPGVEHGGRPLI